MTRFARAAGQSGSYEDLWRWSVDDLEGFWAHVWEYFEVEGGYDRVLGSRDMPGAEWFPGASVNFAEHVFRGKDPAAPAVSFATETSPLQTWSWGRLRTETAQVREGLIARGVARGDRVVAYLPNVPQTCLLYTSPSPRD